MTREEKKIVSQKHQIIQEWPRQEKNCRFPLTDTIGVQLRITKKRWRDIGANCMSSIILKWKTWTR